MGVRASGIKNWLTKQSKNEKKDRKSHNIDKIFSITLKRKLIKLTSTVLDYVNSIICKQREPSGNELNIKKNGKSRSSSFASV